MAEVKLHGTWASPFSLRVICALRLKGVTYEYVEEDLSNKSALLLKYNPVHKKIPVLVHNGKPICESTIIIEYIEEMWPQNPLLPTDPYDKAVARFWVKFADDKLPAVTTLFFGTGQELEKAMKELFEMLETVEEHGLGEEKYFLGDKIGVADIVFGSIFYWFLVIENLVGVKLFEPEKFPRLHAWFENFKQTAIIKENLPNQDELFDTMKRRREMLLASA